MDKLKKVLVYQFWILLGIAVILPIASWVMSRSGMISEAAARQTAIEGAFNGLPKGMENPNEKWINELNDRIKIQTEHVNAAWKAIWERQKEEMTWPREFTFSDPLKSTTRDHQIYRAIYPKQVTATWEIVEPLTSEIKPGKVDFPLALMPADDFSQQAPTAQEMKDAQEDLWLYANLFRGIAFTNKDVQTQNDAPVRQIYGVRLMGGTPRTPGATDPNAGQSAMPGNGGETPGAGGMRANVGLDTAEFEPRDEFGSDANPNAPGGGEGTAMQTAGPMPGGAGMPLKIKPKRYIDENPKWKTRGFYIYLAVDHRRLPDLLVNLMNQKWPVRITRVHQKDLYPEDLENVTGGTAGAPPGGGTALGGLGMGGTLGGGMPVARPPGLGMGGTLGGHGGGKGGSATDGGPAPGLFRPPGGGGEGGTGTAFSGATTDPTQAGAAMNDPMLAQVAISGTIMIYNPPPTDPAAQPAPGTPAVPGATTPAAPEVAPTAPAEAVPATGAPVTPAPADATGAPAATTPTPTTPAAPATGAPVTDPAAKPAEAVPAPAPAAPAVESSTSGSAPPAKPPGT